MYNIRLVRQGNKVNVRHTKTNVVLKTRKQVVKLSHTGKQGIPGVKGDKGDTGIGLPTGGVTGQFLEKNSNTDFDFQWITPAFTGDKNYTAEFGVTNTVAVNHNLNKYPSIEVIDSAGDEVIGEVEYLNTNQVIVRFMAPFSGRITCN